jgi:hypothetical protein
VIKPIPKFQKNQRFSKMMKYRATFQMERIEVKVKLPINFELTHGSDNFEAAAITEVRTAVLVLL